MSAITAGKVSPEKLEVIWEVGEMQRRLMAEADAQLLERFKATAAAIPTELKLRGPRGAHPRRRRGVAR